MWGMWYRRTHISVKRVPEVVGSNTVKESKDHEGRRRDDERQLNT